MTTIPTGPTGDQSALFEADPFVFFRDLQKHGDVVAIDLGGIQTAVLYDLDDIHRIFADKLDHIGRAAVFTRLSHATGTGILTNYDWDTWHPRRRRIVKPLGARKVGQFHDRMIAIIEEHLDGWPLGETFDLYDAIRNITLPVVADLLFTEDLNQDAIDIIERAVDEIHTWAESDPTNTDVENEPKSFRNAMDALDAFIGEVIGKRDPDSPGDDLLGLLIAAIDEPDARLDRQSVRDEAVTLILAGHETVTANVAFALDLVGRHPDTGTADPRHIVDEALRLHPPVHITSKAVVKDLELTDNVIPAGWEVLIPEYVLYRDEQYFERPDEFLPERWEEDSPLHLVPRAFFPFLTGPKFCVGRHFAIMEATELVGRVLDRFDYDMLHPTPPEGRPFALTFAPDRPTPCTLRSKEAS
ncbi:MAG: cytochrome P450 [Acidimicrobiales bacterium]|nr:cytochrome P450 [Acidimicrobiales bacterium]RZV47240.1 MAG: cytochrome P450 [Acidimicrobiales bacterium]